MIEQCQEKRIATAIEHEYHPSKSMTEFKKQLLFLEWRNLIIDNRHDPFFLLNYNLLKTTLFYSLFKLIITNSGLAFDGKTDIPDVTIKSVSLILLYPYNKSGLPICPCV